MSEQNTPQGTPGSQGSDGQQKAGGLIPGILAVLAALLVVFVVFAGVFTYLVKNNVFRLGDWFRPSFANHALLKRLLPAAPEGYDPDAPEYLTQLELAQRYEAYREQVAALEAERDSLMDANTALMAENTSLSAIQADTMGQAQADEASLAAIAQQKAELEILSIQVADALAAGDTTAFKAWFEKLDPAAAEAAYASVLTAESADAQARQAARPFELMDRKKAAEVMKELWSKDKELLLTIVDANKPQTLAEILANMEATLAADITRNLADYRKAKIETPTTTP